MEERKKTGKKVLCGVAVGAANSLFGGGGGMIAVPMLAHTGMTKKCAHATAILLILPISLLSFFLYAVRGLYDFSVMIPTAIGVSFGGVIGAKLLGKLPIKTVNLLFAFLQAAAGLFLGWQKLIFAMLVASVGACIVLLALRMIRKDEDGKEYPFAPFIVTGMLVAALFGTPVLTWYVGLFLL